MALYGAMAVNDLAESSFAGVTVMLQCYGRIGLNNAAAVSDMTRNNLMSRGTTNEQNGNHGMFHQLPEQLQITVIMYAMNFAPGTRASNNEGLDQQ